MGTRRAALILVAAMRVITRRIKKNLQSGRASGLSETLHFRIYGIQRGCNWLVLLILISRGFFCEIESRSTRCSRILVRSVRYQRPRRRRCVLMRVSRGHFLVELNISNTHYREIDLWQSTFKPCSCVTWQSMISLAWGNCIL